VPLGCGNNVREGNEECDGTDASACLGACELSCRCAPPPRKITVAGESISQAFAADCTSGGLGGLVCLGAGDKPQYSWFNGTNAAVNSVHKQYLAINGAVVSTRKSVSGAEMRGTGDSFAAQAGRILAQTPIPDHVEVLYELANGAPVHMKFSETTGLSAGNQIWIFGSEGTIHVDNEQRIFTGRRGDRALTELANPREQQAFHRVEEEFINAIRGRERVAMNTFEIGVRYMEWTEAIYRSASSGTAVQLPLA